MKTKASTYSHRVWRGPAKAALYIALFGAMGHLSHATTIANLNADEDGNNLAPFSAGLFGIGPTERYQQIYAASQFADAGPVFNIGAIAFRLDTIGAPAHIGADDRVVSNGSLTFNGSGGQNPNPFNLIVNLPSPFQYSPSQGNLLLDIRVNQAGNGFMPAFTSRVRSFNDVNSPTGTSDTIGLVTQFSTPAAHLSRRRWRYVVPELPCSYFGTCSGAGGGLLTRRL